MPVNQGVSHKSTADIQPPGVARALDVTRDGAIFSASYIDKLLLRGLIWVATDGDANDTVTGQTSFADTTPTFLLNVPQNFYAYLLKVYLHQTGTVAGGVIDVNMAVSSGATAYASSGTSEAIFCARTDNPTGGPIPGNTFYTGATATTAKLTSQVWSHHAGPDVSPAEAANTEIFWTPQRAGHPILIGSTANATSLGIFTSAGTTGPTWYWSVAWALLPASEVSG